MAKKSQPARYYQFTKHANGDCEGMFSYSERDPGELTESERQELLNYFDKEIAAGTSNQWLVSLAAQLAPAKRLKTRDAKTVRLQSAQQLVEAILAHEDMQKVSPHFLRMCFKLGRRFEEIILTTKFDGRVVTAQRVSRANARKSKPRLDDKQFAKVTIEIDKLIENGVSLLESSKRLSRQLEQGVFMKLPNVKVKLTPDAIRKRYNAQALGNTV